MSQVEQGFKRRSAAFRQRFGGLPSNKTLDLMDTAANEAVKFQHNWIGTEHLLLATSMDPQVAPALTRFKLEPAQVRSAIEFIIGRGDKPVKKDELGLTPRSIMVMKSSVGEAGELNDRLVEPIHVALGIVREGEGIACGIIESYGYRFETVRAALLQARSDNESGAQSTPDFSLEDAQRDIAELNALLTHPGITILEKSHIAALLRTVNRTFNPKFKY